MLRRIVSGLIVFIMGCMFLQEVKESACPKDIFVCPDGSEVGRNPANNCEFDPCPKNVKDKCIYFLHVDMH